jgi:hypothetical protein
VVLTRAELEGEGVGLVGVEAKGPHAARVAKTARATAPLILMPVKA